ncbi:MAG: esterase-like activity of phytase family protein [Myxococcota bacterium]
MSTSRFSSILALACALVMGAGCASSPQESAAEETGSLSLDLVLGDDVEIDTVDWEITGGEMEPMSGTIDVSAPGATASVEVFGLPPTEGDEYTISLQATSVDGGGSCKGAADFGVEVGEATDIMVMLNCQFPTRLGGVRANGKFNICAELSKVIVSPLQTSVGNDIDLASAGFDVEGDAIEYRWTSTGGTIADATAATTTYTCDEEGEQSVTIEVSDDGFEYCLGTWTVPVTCGEGDPAGERSFNRVSSFLICSQIDPTCNDDTETAAEIVTATEDGNTLIYTDSPLEVVGFVDITDPAAPAGLGTVALGGEPTSVAVAGPYALVGVNTSEDFVNTSGDLEVFDIATQTSVRTIPLGGQPDAVAISPDGAYAAVAIENERDEDLGDGAPPQLPAGFLVIVNLSGDVADWTTTNVDLTGITDLFPEDPEPEYVDINADDVVVVTLQENNHIILVDATTGMVTGDFSAGTVDLTGVDLTEDDPNINDNMSIIQTESVMGVPREPDGVTWIDTELLVTADEGDLDGGSRGFTIFNTGGEVVYTSGNTNDQLTARLGHYPDARSGNKGNEPENADFGTYGDDEILIVASERSSVLFVYDVSTPGAPALKQVLPAGAAPEGVLALTSRDLLIAASEEDSRGDKLRSVLNIYVYDEAPATYPTLMSTDREDGSPIPWAAMSGLAASGSSTLYAVEDSFYGANRIFGIDISTAPATLDTEITIKDSNGVFANIPTDDEGDDDDVFSSADLGALINTDNTVNIDPEGVAVASTGGFWVASEGAGTVGDEDRPITSLNFIFKTDDDGVIEAVVTLPDDLNAAQLRFGFEGITEYDGAGYVAFQRRWPDADGGNDPGPRIGIYDLAAGEWSFLFYPLDDPESQNGGWVGLSDLTSLGDGEFLVVERDNQGGPDAAIKRLYTFGVNGLNPGDTVTKTLLRDLVAEGDLTATGGLIAEKIEGSAVTEDGDVYIINDNDGVDDNSGETNLINLGELLD